MVKNVGPADRVVRIVVGLSLGLLVYLQVIEGTAGIIAALIAAALLITGLLGYCLIYKLAGIDTSVQEQPYSTTDDRSGV